MLNTCYLAARRFAPGFLLPYLERVEKSPAGKRLASGVFWSGVGAVISRLLALAGAIVTAQILGKVAFGEFGIIQSTLSMFSTFATFGVGLTATKHIAEYRKANPERAGRIIGMSYFIALVSGSVVALLMIATAGLVAGRFLSAPHLAGMIVISSVGLLFSVLTQAQIGTLSGLEAFRRRSTIQAFAGVAAFPITVAGVYFFGLNGAVWAFVATMGVLVVMNFQGIRQEAARAGIPIVWSGFGREAGVIWRSNIPTLCSGVVYVPSMWVANMILVNGANGYAEMGIFSAADRWRTAIMFLPALLGGVALPMLAGISAESNSRQFRKMLWTNVAISSGLSFAVAAPIALLAPWIMASFGPGFAQGTTVLVLLCATAVSHAAYWIIGQSLVSRGRMWTMFGLNLCWAVLLLSCAWLMRRHGAKGLAVAYFVADTFRLFGGLIVTRGLFTAKGAEAQFQAEAALTANASR